MVNRRWQQSGFTLIELVIVLLIIGLLALMGTPLTSSWGANADVHSAIGQLDRAFAHARAAALRNEAGATGDDPAARILFNEQSHELRVCRLPTGDCEAVLWRGGLPSGVEMNLSAGAFPVELNNRGQSSARVVVQLAKGGVTDEHVLQ